MSGTTSNRRLVRWVEEWAEIMQPTDIYWCDGSQDEYDSLAGELVATGTFTPLDEAKRPNSYWAHSDIGDVARVEVPAPGNVSAHHRLDAAQRRAVVHLDERDVLLRADGANPTAELHGVADAGLALVLALVRRWGGRYGQVR